MLCIVQIMKKMLLSELKEKKEEIDMLSKREASLTSQLEKLQGIHINMCNIFF